MNRKSSAIRWIACLTLLLAGSTQAHAQAVRTWVASYGDDVNPCTRNEPCKTFPAAIVRTAAGGQINVIDSGSYSHTGIFKSITIDASEALGGVIPASGFSGFVINAGPNDVVVLRGLTIDGNGLSNSGIRFIGGGTLHVEKCTINNTAQKGISFEPAGTSYLFVKDTVIRNNTVGGVANGGGILIKPSTGFAYASLDNVRLERNVFGLKVENNSRVNARNINVSGSTNNGIQALSTGGGLVRLNLVDSSSSHNGSNGIQSNGTGAVVRITNVSVMDNVQTGLLLLNSGQILSAGNNSVAGNTPDGAPSGPLPQQ